MWVRGLFLAAAIVLAFGTVRGESSINSYFELKGSRDVMAQTVADLESQNDELAREIKRIKTSPPYAKKVLRDKYHITEDNEQIVFFGD